MPDLSLPRSPLSWSSPDAAVGSARATQVAIPSDSQFVGTGPSQPVSRAVVRVYIRDQGLLALSTNLEITGTVQEAEHSITLGREFRRYRDLSVEFYLLQSEVAMFRSTLVFRAS